MDEEQQQGSATAHTQVSIGTNHRRTHITRRAAVDKGYDQWSAVGLRFPKLVACSKA